MGRCLAVCSRPDALDMYRGCKNYARTGEHTCASHKESLDMNNLFRPHQSPLCYLHLRRESVRENVEEWLRKGILEVRPTDILTLSSRRCWAYFLMLCVRHDKIQPEWNISLYLRVVNQLFQWWDAIAIGPLVITTPDILSMICVKGNCRLFYLGLLQARGACMTEEIVARLIRSAASLKPEWFLEFWMSGEAGLLPAEETMLQGSLIVGKILGSPRIRSLIDELKKDFLGRRLCFEEELVAVAYEPSRMLEWTMDWLEKSELVDRWGL